MRRCLVGLLGFILLSTGFVIECGHAEQSVTSSSAQANVAEVLAATATPDEQEMYHRRMAYYIQMSEWTHMPWYTFAAIDQYERTVQSSRKQPKKQQNQRTLAITVEPSVWAGWLNPDPNDTNPDTIQFFGGIGQDGNGDGIADPSNDDDVMAAFLHYLAPAAGSEEDFFHALWEYYGTDYAVHHIRAFAAIYRTFQRLDLYEYTFPIPRGYHYTYHDTWGHSRAWGGRRIHEGTDIFAPYGTPVRSVSYGYVEVMGWNKYGGWRIGIRDLRNIYHYYAHLSGFEKSLRPGQVVKPGQIIGYVGSSGYGKPGTQGKFPPHLHYGMYKFDGRNQWAFDPYPSLKAWERADRNKNKHHQQLK